MSLDTLEAKIAQLVFVRIGSNLPPIVRVNEDEQRIAKLLEQLPLGGLLLFNGRWPEAGDSLERLQHLNRHADANRHPLLVGADLERGAGQQVHGLTVFPHARALGGTSAQQLERLAATASVAATEALAAGVHILFAPVADANTNPKNPIIATRAFGDSPKEVATSVATFVQAVEAAGALATAKHFPGHGDTSQDSHDSLPVVPRRREELNNSELVPFRAAIDAGVSLMMTAHVAYPDLDPTCVPATLSHPISTELLREELGFQGVICTDSLLMAGARDQFETEGELAAAALRAGADLLLDLAEPVETVAYLVAAVQKGELDGAKINRSVERVLRLKQRVFSQPMPTLDEAHFAKAAQLANEVAREAIVVYSPSTDESCLPLTADVPLTTVLLKPFHLPTDPPEQPLAAALRDRLPEVNYFEYGPEPPAEALAEILQTVGDNSTLLIAIIAKPAAWHVFGMTPGQKTVVEQLLAARSEENATIVASLGVGTILQNLPDYLTKLCTYSDVPVSQQALAERLVRG